MARWRSMPVGSVGQALTLALAVVVGVGDARASGPDCHAGGVLLPWTAVGALWPVVGAWRADLGAEVAIGASALGAPLRPQLSAQAGGVLLTRPPERVGSSTEVPCRGDGCSPAAVALLAELDALRALGQVVAPARGAVDPELEAERVRLSLESAARLPAACDAPMAPSPPRESVSLPPSGPDAPAPPRLHVVFPAPPDTGDARGVVRLLGLLLAPGAPLQRALAGPPARVAVARLALHPGVGAATLSLDLPPTSDWREAERQVAAVLSGPLPWVGEASLAAAGIAPDDHARLRPLLGSSLAQGGLTFVHIAGLAAPEAPSVRQDPERHARYVLAAATLRCPAPGDERDPVTRLEELHGLSADDWRELSREVATDPEVAAGLEREVTDRCGELAWLRARLPPKRLLTLWEAWTCRIRRVLDPEARYRAVRALLERFGLDSAVLEPAVAMGRLDPAVAEAMEAVERRCASTDETSTRGGPR